MNRIVITKGKIHIFLAVMSVVAIYGSAVLLPEALPPVLIGVILMWGIVVPERCFLLLFPSIAPFMNITELPGLTGISLLTVFTGGILFVSLLRPKRFFKMFAGIPKYALVGIGWLLAVEVISGLFFSPAANATIVVNSRIIKTVQFGLGAAFACQAGSLATVEAGWIIYGVLQVISAIVLQISYSSVLGMRGEGGGPIELGSMLSSAALVANIGYMAIASSWFAVSAALRKKGLLKVLLFSIAVFSILASFYSGRRQALLALVFSVLLAITILKGRRGFVAAVAMTFILIGVFLTGPVQEFLQGRQSLFSELAGERGVFYMPINKAGINAFLESPWFGIGLGDYSSATLGHGIQKRGLEREGEASHNTVIRILAETGLIGAFGLAILSFGFGFALIRIIKSLRASPTISSMHMVLPTVALVLTGYAVTILDNSIYIFFFGEVIGLLHQYTKLRWNIQPNSKNKRNNLW